MSNRGGGGGGGGGGRGGRGGGGRGGGGKSKSNNQDSTNDSTSPASTTTSAANVNNAAPSTSSSSTNTSDSKRGGHHQRGGGRGGGGGADAAARRAAAEAEAAAAEKARVEAAERAKAEAEAKKLADIAAARAKAEADAAAKAAEEKRALFAATKARYEEETTLWNSRLQLREVNLAAAKAAQPFEPSAKMDSSIKKCSGYINKLKLLQQHPQEALLKELATVTLHKYVSEVVTTLLELRFTKSADLFKAIHVASIMYQRHGSEFTSGLISGLVKVFEGQKTTWKRQNQERQNIARQIASSGGASNAANANIIAATTPTAAEIEEEKNVNSRKRYTMRFLTELFLCGLTTDFKPLLGVLSDLVQSDTRNEPDYSNTVLQLINSWLKYASEPILGLQSRKQAAANKSADLPPTIAHPEYLTQPQREQILAKLFVPYSKQLHERLLGVHTSLQKLEKRAARIQMMRGEIPLDMQEERKSLREQMSALEVQVDTYFDSLDLTLEPLPEIQDAEDEIFNLVSLESSDAGAIEGESNLGPWDDVETKMFYESFIDLRVVVPPVLLAEGNEKEKSRIRREKAAADAGGADDEEEEEKEAVTAKDEKKKRGFDEDDSYLGNWDMTIEQLEAKVQSMLVSRANKSSTSSSNEPDYGSMYEEDADGNPIIPERFIGKEKRSHPMELLLSSIPHSLNRESIDQIAEKFCYLNTKNNRMRLVEAIYTLPRNRVDEIPFYCRLLATLSQHMKQDMVDELVHLFTGEFYRLLRGKNQYRIESKIRNIRFLTEFVKFQLAPATLIFKCWHALLLSFNPNAITLIALILEHCGRWLYRTPAYHMLTAKFLDRTMQLKETKYLDKSSNLLLENAFFSVKPPPTVQIAIVKKQRTPIHEYIRKTILHDLKPSTTDEVIRRLRQLHWNEVVPPETPELSERVMVIKCLSNIGNIAFGNIGSVALVVSVLHKFHQIGFVVVDNVLEEIRCGLEMNRYSQQQRRIAFMNYLGELYLFHLFDSQVIFDTLYLLLTLGHEVDEGGKLYSKMDPPSDTFRIRLIVTLLEVTGSCFDHGSGRKRLDRFLLYFQRYLFLKEIVPIDLEFAIADLLERIRPNLVRLGSLEEVQAEIAKVESQTDHSTPDRLISLTGPLDTLEVTPVSSDNEGDDEEKEDEDENEVDDQEDEKDGEAGSYADKARDGANASLLDAAASALDDLDDDDADEDGEDDDDEDDEDEDEDDAFDRHATRATNHRSKEEEEFQAEYDRMMADAIESAKFQPRTNTMGTVQAVTSAAGLPESRTQQSPQTTIVDGEEHAVFRFLSRNPKKQTTQARSLLIPSESDMVSSTLANQVQEAKEKEEQKRLVLKGLQRTEREQAEEERLSTQERQRAERATGVTHDFSHRSIQPNQSSSSSAVSGNSLARVGALMGSRQKKEKDDLSLKVSDFAFAGEDTLTQSRVTLQGGRPQYQGKK